MCDDIKYNHLAKKMRESSITAFVLALIGGICVLVGGIWLTIAGAFTIPIYGGKSLALGIFAAIGILIIISSIISYRKPSAKKWGVVALILGISSIVSLLLLRSTSSITALPAIGGVTSIIGGIFATQLSFISQADKTMKLAIKPGRSELWLSIKIRLLGIGAIGLIGFVIKLLSFAAGGATAASSS